MIILSAIILSKNDENMIADCIDSVSFCDEIILMDNGSTDRTTEIAKQMGAKIYTDKDTNFAEKRNNGKQRAKGTWLLYVDTDERVSSKLREKIKEVVEQKDNPFVAYKIKRQNYYLGKHKWPQIEEIARLFKKESLTQWFGALHETAQVDGETGELDGYLLHYTHRNLTDMVTKTNLWSETEAELRLSANHPKMTWWRFPRVMLTAFYDSYIHQKGYEAGTMGLIESMYQMFSIFITYAKLWEKQQEHNGKMTK
jgi:glycosyltransferase involved in cell wall biosynthesis